MASRRDFPAPPGGEGPPPLRGIPGTEAQPEPTAGTETPPDGSERAQDGQTGGPASEAPETGGTKPQRRSSRRSPSKGRTGTNSAPAVTEPAIPPPPQFQPPPRDELPPRDRRILDDVGRRFVRSAAVYGERWVEFVEAVQEARDRGATDEALERHLATFGAPLPPPVGKRD